jgi:proline dehydrogenase
MKVLNAFVVRALPLVPRAVVRRIASRYVAGETLDDALRCVKSLQCQGCMATVDVLGEDITRLEETEQTVTDYRQALEAISSRGLDSNISVKLTALGLKIDPAVCRRQFWRILEAAQARGNFVRIDMEDSSVTDETIRTYEEARQRFANVGLVLQAYLRRTLDDARRVARIRANVRICKGIYVEPPEIAFQGRQEIRENFLALLELLLSEKCYVGIATHDPPLIDGANASIGRRGLSRGEYEFQMLLGVAVEARRRLVAAGHRLRVYVPYGGSWYAYSIRRLKENPAIAGHVMKGLFTGLGSREP